MLLGDPSYGGVILNLEKIVYLLIGQRGSGKTTYTKKLTEEDKKFYVINRDDILIKLFGSVHLSPYTGEHFYADNIVFRLLRKKLSAKNEVKIILDYWTGSSLERRTLIRKLREYGATKVIALYFITPLELVEKWFWEKPGIAKMSRIREPRKEEVVYFSEDAPSHDYEIFHDLAKGIDADGFNQVIRIDPLKTALI